MSDYFRFYCDGLDEPRLLYAIHQSPHVPVVWLWVLCECARTKKNQIEQPSNAMLVGLQHKLNVPAGSVQLCLKLLVEIEYLEHIDCMYIVRKWNELQSKYMQEKAWKETHKNQKKPKETKNPIGEERRGDDKERDTHIPRKLETEYKALRDTGKMPSLAYETLATVWMRYPKAGVQALPDLIAALASEPGPINSPEPWLDKKLSKCEVRALKQPHKQAGIKISELR